MRKSFYWWTPALKNLRKIANHARRRYQRKKRRLGLDECTAELSDMKKSKLELTKAIKNAKELCWKQLCDQIGHDLWGKNYKLVMGNLTKSHPPPKKKKSSSNLTAWSKISPKDFSPCTHSVAQDFGNLRLLWRSLPGMPARLEINYQQEYKQRGTEDNSEAPVRDTSENI